jgi:hypothetical protein
MTLSMMSFNLSPAIKSTLTGRHPVLDTPWHYTVGSPESAAVVLGHNVPPMRNLDRALEPEARKAIAGSCPAHADRRLVWRLGCDGAFLLPF